MDRLEAMTALLTAVETGSLSAASRKLGIPLATVSRNVSNLETHLRAKLVIRTSRRLTLTEAGRAYVGRARRILDDLAEAERDAMGEYAVPRGDLHITAPIVFGRLHVLPVVTEFLKAYPEIDVRLVLADRIVNMVEEQVDACIRIGALPDSSLIAVKVGTVGRIVCGSPDYFAARGVPDRPQDLAKHDCVSFEGATSAKVWVFRTREGEIAVPVRSRLSVNSAEASVDAAVAGVGVTRLLSYQAVEALAAAALVPVLEAFEPDPAPVNVVYSGQGLIPLKLRAFLDFARPRLNATLAQLAGYETSRKP